MYQIHERSSSDCIKKKETRPNYQLCVSCLADVSSARGAPMRGVSFSKPPPKCKWIDRWMNLCVSVTTARWKVSFKTVSRGTFTFISIIKAVLKYKTTNAVRIGNHHGFQIENSYFQSFFCKDGRGASYKITMDIRVFILRCSKMFLSPL